MHQEENRDPSIPAEPITRPVFITGLPRSGTSFLHNVLAEDPDRHVWGLGRHHAGSNFFWYLRDPAGNFSEYFSDMDCNLEDPLWSPEVFQGRDDRVGRCDRVGWWCAAPGLEQGAERLA